MAMRGIDVQPRDLFSYIQLEHRVPSKHPLRAIHKMVDIFDAERIGGFILSAMAIEMIAAGLRGLFPMLISA